MLKAYYHLTKPGIIYGNVFTAAAGFLLGAKGTLQPGRLLATLAGTALVIASACVINNYIDRDIDAKMVRTQRRALVRGNISGRQALVYAAVLGAAGFAILAAKTNTLTLIIGSVGFIDYVALYTWSKRHTTHATLIGSISGATPITAGYTAASGTFDASALLVFIILVAWQMPHFYAIAMYRIKDYGAADIPVLPLKKSIRQVKLQMLLYGCAFVAAAIGLGIVANLGWVYMLTMAFLGCIWLGRMRAGLQHTNNNEQWARALFRFSLIVLLGLCIAISIDSLLPAAIP